MFTSSSGPLLYGPLSKYCTLLERDQGVTVPSVLITMGTTVAFTFHIFHSFSCSFFLMLLSLSYATFSSTTTMSNWLVMTSLSVCIWKSHKISAQTFSSTFGSVSHFVLGPSSPYLYRCSCTLEDCFEGTR